MKKFLKCFFKIADCISALAAIVAGFAFIVERIEELKNYGKGFIGYLICDGYDAYNAVESAKRCGCKIH